MAGFDPGSFGTGSDHSINCATNTVHPIHYYNSKIICILLLDYLANLDDISLSLG